MYCIFSNLYFIEGSGGIHVYITPLTATYFPDDSVVAVN
jgi:hypothetical protein